MTVATSFIVLAAPWYVPQEVTWPGLTASQESQNDRDGKATTHALTPSTTGRVGATRSLLANGAENQGCYDTIAMRTWETTNRATLKSSARAVINDTTLDCHRALASIAGVSLRSSSAGAATSATSTFESTDATARQNSLLRAARFYRQAIRKHHAKLGRVAVFQKRGANPYLVHVLQRKARAWRLRAEAHIEAMKTLRDFRFCDGCKAWHKAVQEVQRVFPGTASWLLSCSGAEGGHGRWVGYSGVAYSTWLRDSDTVGGPMQFRFSTFTGMYRRGVDYVVGRGFRVPRMDLTTAWRSALGQAIAAGWARFTGNDNSHWSASFGRGC